MSALQAAAATHPASYHFGVVTSDLGAGPYAADGCNPGGDGGKLQAAPTDGCKKSASCEVLIPPACSSLTLGGAHFIDYDQVQGTTNTGSVDLPTALKCISLVGTSGCGFEHQLESVYKALHDPVPENEGFLRSDALLVVVFLTDEDDCSGTPDDTLFDPSPDGVAAFGPATSFRCTQFGIACGDPAMAVQPMASNGPLANCRPLTTAEGGKLIDVQKYIDFFARPGGVKADPSDVILTSLAAPTTPFVVSVSTSGCPSGTSCAALDNSCGTANPAVRLSTVVGAAYTSQATSVCDDSYAPAFDSLAQKIIARLK